MVGTVLDINEILGPSTDSIALAISKKYMQFEMYRNTWMTQNAELRNYLFATDTTTTSNKALPWKNSTTTPKLTQIRDNLHANYMTALFPNDNWLQWEGNDQDAELAAKRNAIEAYMKTKFRLAQQKQEVSKLLLDFIDYGNCFATAEYVDESLTVDGKVQPGYIGPKIVRISPMDIVFNPTAPNFQSSPKVIRSISTLGELQKRGRKMPEGSTERKMLESALERTINIRRTVQALSPSDTFKIEGYLADGFSSLRLYYQTDYVELLTFYGDIYDSNNEKFYENRVITVMDRYFLVEDKPNPGWTTSPGIYHASWRQRPDNLYGMGPLANLVGMQYRIDHLENLKADVFDMIAYPMPKIKGFVDDFVYAPGERVYCGDEGDVEFLHPPETALNADNQIEILMRRMEEMAGAPKEAMGFRTPGEKTKFEVQLLDNAASRVFINKITHFQEVFFEPLLNYMLTLGRQNLDGHDIVKTLNSEIDAVVFSKVTRDDLIANGILRPQGATIYAYKANLLQTLTAIGNSHFAQDAAVNVHLSGKKIAKMIEETADLESFNIYGENVRIMEMAETQKLMNSAQEQVDVHQQTPPGILPGDPASVGADLPPTSKAPGIA